MAKTLDKMLKANGFKEHEVLANDQLQEKLSSQSRNGYDVLAFSAVSFPNIAREIEGDAAGYSIVYWRERK
jgi:hypothetical protein